MMMQSGAVVFNYTHMDPTRGYGGANRTPGGMLSLARLPDGRQCVSFLKSNADAWTEYHGNWRTLIGNALEINFKYTGRDDALVHHIFYCTSAVDPPCSPDHRQPTYHFQSGAKYYYAFKRERCNGPLHTIYLTEPQYLPCAVLIRERLRPLRLLDNLEAGADADDLTPRHPLGNWVYLQQDPVYEICDDDEIVHILSGPQYEYD